MVIHNLELKERNPRIQKDIDHIQSSNRQNDLLNDQILKNDQITFIVQLSKNF